MKLHEAVEYLESLIDEENEEETPMNLYIEPPEAEYDSAEDDGNEAEGGSLMNLHHNQLRQMCELELLNTGCDNDEDDDDGYEEPQLVPEASDVPNVVVQVPKPFAYTGPEIAMPPVVLHVHDKFKRIQDEMKKANPIFPAANYLDCAKTPHEGFEQFFDDNVLQMIVDRSNEYAILQEQLNLGLTIKE